MTGKRGHGRPYIRRPVRGNNMIDAGYNGPRLVALYDEDNAGSGH